MNNNAPPPSYASATAGHSQYDGHSKAQLREALRERDLELQKGRSQRLLLEAEIIELKKENKRLKAENRA